MDKRIFMQDGVGERFREDAERLFHVFLIRLTAPDNDTIVGDRIHRHAGELRLPLAVAVGGHGEGLFAFVNYNVGSVRRLLQILDARGEV